MNSPSASAVDPAPEIIKPSTSGGMQLRDLPGWVPFLIICAFGLLAYGMSLNADFYMDDYPFVLEQETVTGGEWNPHGRGFRQIPFALWRGVYAVAGESSFAFHALNVLTHIGTACALFLAGGLLFGRLGLDRIKARRAALIGALVFVVHPFASDAVNYARCLEIELVTLFSVLALWAMLRLYDRTSLWIAIALLAFITGAIFSKGPGLFHAGAILALVGLALYQKGAIVNGLRASWEKSKPLCIGVAAIVGIATFLLGKKFWIIAVTKMDVHGMAYYGEHALTQGRVFWAYLAKMVAPFGMTSDHLVAWSTSASDFPALLGLIGAVVLCIAAVVCTQVKRFRIVALFVALAVAPLALRFLYPNNELFVEYRAYPALPFVGLLAGFGLSALYDRAHGVGKWTGLALLVALSVLSAARSVTWANAEWLAEDSLEKHPLNNRARTQLQAFAYRSGDYTRVFQLAKEVDHNFAVINHAELPHGRRYESGRALRNLVNSHQLVTFAIAEISGSEKAIAFADRSLAQLAAHLKLDPEGEEFAKTAGNLQSAREAMIEHGAENDRRLAAQTPVEPQ